MQLRLALAQSAAPAVALWELVGPEERRAAIALLTGLIAQTVAGVEGLDDRAPVDDQDACKGGDD